MKSTMKSAINAIKSAPRSSNGGVHWMADQALMAKVAIAIIGSDDELAAMEEITAATGVIEPTLRLFIRGKDAQHRRCQAILDGLKSAGLTPVAFTPRPNRSHGKKYCSISAASQPEPTSPGRDCMVEAWSLKELRGALVVTRNRREDAKNTLTQKTKDMVDSCESYVQVFNEVAGRCGKLEETDPFSVIVKTGTSCVEVINFSIAVRRAIDDWNQAVKNHKELLEDYKVLRGSRWPFLPELLD